MKNKEIKPDTKIDIDKKNVIRNPFETTKTTKSFDPKIDTDKTSNKSK